MFAARCEANITRYLNDCTTRGNVLMHMSHKLGAGLAGVGLVLLLAQGDARAQSLDEVLVETYQTNPRLQAARAELRAVDEQVSQSYARYRPNVSIFGTTGYGRVDNSVQNNDLFNNQVGIDVRQNLYEGGGTVARIEGAVRQVGQQRAVLQSVEQQVFLDAVTAYTDVVAFARTVGLAINNEERLERQRQATVDRFEVGEVTRTDVAQAEARLALAVSDRIRAEGDLAQAIARFEAVVGFRPGELTTQFPSLTAPASLVEAQARAEKNPTLTASEFAVDVALSDVRVAQAALLPTLDLSATASYIDEPAINVEDQFDTRFEATFTIPLYQGGAAYSQVRQNKQIVDQRRRELEDARRSVSELVTRAWEGLQTATAAARSFEDQVRANRIALEGVQTEAQVGARTVLDVLDAEQELFISEVDLVDARATQVVALYTLQSAMGELTAEGLGLAVETYDPSEHYQTVDTQGFGTEAGEPTFVLEEIDFTEEWGRSLSGEPIR